MVTPGRLSPKARGWLRHLWRKAMTPDDWSSTGKPHPWWDAYSLAPMLSYPRFDLSELSYALLIMARKTPAWREAYVRILDELIRRHTTHWAAVDWLTQIGPDPDRARYPKAYKALIPKHLWGQYDVPGWTANGVEPWGLQPDPIGSPGNLFFRGFFNLLLGIYRDVAGTDAWDRPSTSPGLRTGPFPGATARSTGSSRTSGARSGMGRIAKTPRSGPSACPPRASACSSAIIPWAGTVTGWWTAGSRTS